VAKHGRDESETGLILDNLEQRHCDAAKQNDSPEAGGDCCDGKSSNDPGDFCEDEVSDADIRCSDRQSTSQAPGERVRVSVDFSVESQASERERRVSRDARPCRSLSSEARDQQQVADNVRK
jgi:hypothetical protein